MDSNLSRIARDGSLIFSDGTNIKAYSPTGAPKWSIPAPVQLADIAIGPTGTVYTSTVSGLLWAWNKDTGQAKWSSPYNVGDGVETSPLAIDASGVIYFIAGRSLAAVNPDGTEKWKIGTSFRGYSRVVLSTDESIAYFLDLMCCTWWGTISWERGVSTATGQDVYGATFDPRSNTWLYAPWDTLYMPGSDGWTDFLLGCTKELSCTAVPGGLRGINTVVPGGILVIGTTGVNRQGETIWTAPDGLSIVVSDANGTLYAIASQTNNVVALNGNTGTELWRQPFPSTPSALLLGDDGTIYVIAGTTLYKSSLTPNCSVQSLKLDTSRSNGLISASVSPGSAPCEFSLTLSNPKMYWTNFQILASGAAIEPVGGAANLYATMQVLPPRLPIDPPVGSPASFRVRVTNPGESATVYVDPTIQTSTTAAAMNLTQGLMDLLPGGSGSLTLTVDSVTRVVTAFSQMPHLQAAADALFQPNPRFRDALRDLAEFFRSDERLVLDRLLVELGAKVTFEGIKGVLGYPAQLVLSITRNFGNIYTFAFRYPSGSIQFVAQ